MQHVGNLQATLSALENRVTSGDGEFSLWLLKCLLLQEYCQIIAHFAAGLSGSCSETDDLACEILSAEPSEEDTKS